MNAVITRTVTVGNRHVPTDSEGYLKNLQDWSEGFAQALAREEGLALTPEHWEVIRFLREYYQEHGVQAQVRVMIRHFARAWGPQRARARSVRAGAIGGPFGLRSGGW